MWRSISNSISSFGQKKSTVELGRACQDSSDDDTSSNASTEEGLECPICWESFNIVENVPHVLWCGHTLCKNCVLGLRWAALKFYAQQIQIPLFISCPWCNLLTFRLVYRGNLRFPSKNFFLLWMVESRNGDRVKSASLNSGDCQQVWSPNCTSVVGNYSFNNSHRRTHRLGQSGSNNDNHNHNNGNLTLERPQLSLHKSIDLFIRMTAKFPLVVLLLIVIFALPTSATILMLYLVITVLFALPAFLVLYFAYPALDWLGREIRT
ncbi:RING/U-box superfamily protein [Forsythia ovata]|uniref:RING/U-box superfamily protein n=1 Tax=Forsythia ovata TaxID=205694 RepID=A0ABD1WAK3_9LAMI